MASGPGKSLIKPTMFKDSPEGKTHYFGDGCTPPHRCPEGKCRPDCGNAVCLVCNARMLDDKIKVLNLYAGIGGNRKLWGPEFEVTAVEMSTDIANIYRRFFPGDRMIVGDAHEYLLGHFREFDFIWSSPPCPTHSRLRTMQKHVHYPDMRLYEEIILLRHFFKSKFCVENVVSYYDPLIAPTATLDRHYFWSNFPISDFDPGRSLQVVKSSKEELMEYHGIVLPPDAKDQRKLMRNAVNPKIGRHVMECSFEPKLL